MTAAGAEPLPAAWQHDVPILGRLHTAEIRDALDWRSGEYFQLAVGRNGGKPYIPKRGLSAVDKIESPGRLIALESPTEIDGIAGHIADAIYFAANPVDPDFLDRRPVIKPYLRPNRWDITRFAAFVMDLDFKPGGVVDQAGAQDLIRRFAEVTGGWYPALLVDSGHGWQPTYRVAGGELTGEFGPSQVSILLARIGTLVATLAAELNLGVDSVFEATRLQRMPGSINGKDIAHPVPAKLLPLDRIESHPGVPVGMDLATLVDLLDSEDSDAHTPVTPRHLARGKAPILTDASLTVEEVDWPWAPDGSCPYVDGMVAGWPRDTPAARNPWLFSNAIRLACAYRLGCLTEQQWHDATAVLVGRFRHLLTITAPSGPPRDEQAGEVEGCFARALAYAGDKSHEELTGELGGHDPTDPFTKALHLPPDDGGTEKSSVSPAPLPSPMPLVDTAPIADLVTSLVADVAAPVPSPIPSPPSPVGGVPADYGKDDPACLWPDPKPAGGMSKLAREILKRHHRAEHPDGRPRFTLRYVLGDWWTWTRGKGWARFTTSDKPLEAVALMLRQRLEFAWFNREKVVSGHKTVVKERLNLNTPGYHELVKTVQAVVASNGPYGGTDLRGWLIDRGSATEWVNLTNGILNIRTRRWHPHDPDLFDPSGALGLSWPTDGTRPPPPARWFKFLAEVFPATVLPPPPPDDPVVMVDAEEQATLDGIAAVSQGPAAGPAAETRVVPLGCQADRLQEVFGYLLTHETRAQKIISLTGPPAGGKSTVLGVLEALLKDHYVAPTEADMIDRFGLWSLMNASVAAVTDSRLDMMSPTSQRRFLQLLLSVSGEDKKLVQRKNLPDWHGRLGCRIVITSNELLALEDDTGALMRRILPIEFPRSIEGRSQDPDLLETLRGELAGILDWGLGGRDRLESGGHQFTATLEGELVAESMQQAVEPLTEFINLYLEEAPPHEWVVFDHITLLYSWWAERSQNIVKTKQYSSRALGNKLRARLAKRGIIPHVWQTRENGKPVPRRWRGVRFTELGGTTAEAIRAGTVDM